jgi:YD repeat-containing protein
MLVDGSGLVNVFQPPAAPGGAYVSQAGDFSTLVKLADGTFQRTLTDQTVYHFNASNQLATITDRNENVTTYAYDASGHLATITDPVGLVTHFTYTGNRITAITDPAKRTTQLAYDTAGNLAMITNPDGSHTEYQYDAQHHLIGETDPLGHQSQDLYDSYGRARMAIRRDGSVVTFHPVQVQGLQPPGGPFDPFHAPPAGTNLAQYVDGNGHVKDVTYNYAGYVVAQSDGAGSLGSAQRDSNFLVTVGTDGNGYRTLYTYDANGNVKSSQSAFPGGQVSGQITNPGDQDIYTFQATQGQRFLYEGLGSASTNIEATLTGPSGQTIFTVNAASNSNTEILTEAGTYQLTLAGLGTATGTYKFQVLNPIQTGDTLTIGTLVSGAIVSPGDQAVYTFTGSVGERIFYDPTTKIVSGQRAQLFDPLGNPVFNTNWSRSPGPIILSQSGTYRLLLSGDNGTTGSYSFSVLNPVSPTTPLTLNTPVTGSLANPWDQAVYTFTGAPGQRITYDASTSPVNAQQVQLFDPFGNTVFNNNWSTDEGPITLTQSGTYRLLFSGAGGTTGSYSFRVLDAASQPVPTLGATVNGTLNPGLDADVYQIHGTQGQRLTFHSLTPSASARWTLYGIGDQVIQGAGFGTDFTVTLPAAGTDLLVISGTDASHPVSYSFQITDVSDAPQTPSGFGVVHSGTIAAGGTATYQYTAPAGLTVALDNQIAAPSSLLIDLLDPSNNLVFATDAATDVGATVLPRGGTYTLRIRNQSSTATGSYQFDLLDLAADSKPLTLGTTVSDTLPAYQIKTYQFSGTAGERVFYHGLGSMSLGVYVSLDGPSGGVFYPPDAGGSTVPNILPSTGTYILTVHGIGSGSGAYSFNLRDAALTTAPLTLGTPITGTLANPGDEAAYTFTGTAGERVFYKATVNSSNILANLQGPDNEQLFTQGTALPIILPVAGTYTLVLSGSGPATGGYGFDLLQSAFSVAALTLGTPITGTLANPRDQAAYTFTGTAGQRIAFDDLATGVLGFNVHLVSPSGTSLINQEFEADTGLITLPENGTYSLAISFDFGATGNYAFQLLDETSAPLVPLGTTVSGTLNPGLGGAVYKIAGTAGQTLYFHALGTDSHGRWNLYTGGPSPTEVIGSGSTGLTGDFQVTLPYTGGYDLLLSGGQPSGAPVSYSFRVTAAAAPVQPLGLGATVQGTISQLGETVTYTFPGRVGQRLVYNALQSDSSSITAVLTSPSGFNVFTINVDQNDGPLTLSEAGTYTLTIQAGLGATGPYAFQLQDIATAPALTLGTTVSGTLTPGLADALYQFSGTAGQRLNFLSLAAASGNWSLYSPSPIVVGAPANQLIAFSSLASGFVANLPVTGTYVLVIQGNNTNAPVSYQFQATDVSDQQVTPAGFGTVQSGTIAPGQSKTYTFKAPAGLPILFNNLNDTANLLATLRDPSGNTVFSFSIAASFPPDTGPYILQRAGNYVLTIQGDSASDSGSYQFQMLDLKDGSTPLALNTPVSGSLSPGLQAISYSFTIPVGELVAYDALSTASTGVQALLVSAGGNQVFDIDANDDNAPVSLLEGSYRLILEGTMASGGSYSFQLLDSGAAPVLPLDGSAVTGTLNPGVSTTLYSVQGNAGDRIAFHIATSTGFWGWSLYGPGGPLPGSPGGASDFTATLPASGPTSWRSPAATRPALSPTTSPRTSPRRQPPPSRRIPSRPARRPTPTTRSSTSSPVRPTRSATRYSSRSTRPTATS